MTLTERIRAAQGRCIRCDRRAPHDGLLMCRACVERIVAPPERKWPAKVLA